MSSVARKIMPAGKGLHLGQTAPRPDDADNGLHLGQVSDRSAPHDNGLHLGDSQPEDQNLIVNGEFDRPLVNGQVPGWYAPADQQISVTSGPDPNLVIGLEPVTTSAGDHVFQGQVSQDVNARAGVTYTLQFGAISTFSALIPHPTPEVFWDGSPVDVTLVASTVLGPSIAQIELTYEATVVGRPGMDTLTLRISDPIMIGAPVLDEVSLTPAATQAGWAIA